MSRINAFILAAGYGERLRPITEHIPKPLLPILGRPILGIVLDRISLLSPDKIGINMHHQWEKIRSFTEQSHSSGRIELFHEKDILGTGGALFHARSLLKESICIVHNADILTDIDLKELIKKHRYSNDIATLAVHDYVKFNNVWTDGRGNLRYVGIDAVEEAGLSRTAFMGIAVYSPEFLSFLPEGRSSVVDAWLHALKSCRTIGTLDFSGSDWKDIGTPDGYAEAVFDALKKDGEVAYIHSTVDCSRIELGRNAVIEEGAAVSGKISISNSILLPGAEIHTDRAIDQTIAGPGFTIKIGTAQQIGTISLDAPLMQMFCDLAGPGPVGAVSIGSGGSNRAYYRIMCNNRTAVLMKCAEPDPDYERHLAYTRFFRAHLLPVPEILAVDEMKREALFEDLGDISLYSWARCRRSPECLEAMYQKVLDIIVSLHADATYHLSECPLLQRRTFDYGHLRWETSYFLDRFALGIKGVNRTEDTALEMEFDRLAKKVDAYHKTIVHRDFQSQNIMIVKDEIPRLIDYQSARVGPPAYDLASILWDPYVRIDEGMRGRLLDYYVQQVKGVRHDFDESEFIQSLLPCRMQRHMQALGAYGFLSKVKGKNYFLKHVKQALEYLKEETELAKEAFPAIHNLVARLA